MAILKEIKRNELYLYMNGNLIYKRWLDSGQSKVFDIMAYDKHTSMSIRDFKYDVSSVINNVNSVLKLKVKFD